MNQTPDRLLTDWLGEGPDRGPQHGLERALAATRRTAQRPGWTFASAWVPAPLAARASGRPRTFAILLAAVLLAAALAAIAVFVGSARRAAPPFGLASNGSILLDVDGRLWQADADGTNPRPFVAGNLGRALSPVYSPDGRRVAYLTQAGDLQPMSIYVADADGSHASNVTGDMKVIAGPLDVPAWSPDGSRLAFMSDTDGINRIYTVGADGSGLSPVTEADANRRYPTWSPDGEWLAYQLKPRDATGGTHVAISHPDGSDERRLVSVPQVNPATLAAPQWAPDSKRLAYFTSGVGNDVVGIVDLDGIRTPLSRDTENAFNPLWSPDGRRLLYSHHGATVVDPDNPRDRIEIPAGFADCAAAWAPDATAILGFGTDCTSLFRIPLSDPAAAIPIDLPAGLINGASWQRTSR
jgi:Tol biopolymer transport system component